MLGENIELVAELDPQAAAVRMSDTAMRQIALNLLLNARDAMPNGGRITLTARNCVECVDTPSGLFDGYVEFTVTDSGCGMDAATRIRLFEPFFTTKAVGHGNGLGLATVQRIVSEANGSLEVQSEPNKGTRISVRLSHQGAKARRSGHRGDGIRHRALRGAGHEEWRLRLYDQALQHGGVEALAGPRVGPSQVEDRERCSAGEDQV